MEGDLAGRVRSGDRAALARALTLVENGVDESGDEAAMAALLTGTVRAHVVGVTGSPGAGKSTLIGQLARRLRQGGLRVGILAVDPTSPFSGGAVLGDRLRMALSADDPGLFMRSVASRGQQGGVALAVFGMVRVLDAAGMEVIFVETVGAGQNDVAVLGVADTVLLVINPGSGDEIQALKAGVIEIGDVVVVHKADLPSADEAYRALVAILRMGPPTASGWEVPILMASSVRGSGLDDILEALRRHREFLAGGPAGQSRRRLQAEWELRAALEAAVDAHIVRPAKAEGRWEALAGAIAAGQLSSARAAAALLDAGRMEAASHGPGSFGGGEARRL